MGHPVVIRVAKLATWGAIIGSGQHTWRERETPNAVPELTPNNEDWRPVRDSQTLRDAVSERIAMTTEKPTAKHPVLCLEYLVTAHQDAFAENGKGGTLDSTAYFRDALAWIERKHGAANVVAVNIQRDEAAPHLVAYVVPNPQQQASERRAEATVAQWQEIYEDTYGQAATAFDPQQGFAGWVNQRSPTLAASRRRCTGSA